MKIKWFLGIGIPLVIGVIIVILWIVGIFPSPQPPLPPGSPLPPRPAGGPKVHIFAKTCRMRQYNGTL